MMTEDFVESAYDLHGLIFATRILAGLIGKSKVQHSEKLCQMTEELLDIANARACGLWCQANAMLKST
jgi:hypothetical protein